jgi:hypothetical protein
MTKAYVIVRLVFLCSLAVGFIGFLYPAYHEYQGKRNNFTLYSQRLVEAQKKSRDRQSGIAIRTVLKQIAERHGVDFQFTPLGELTFRACFMTESFIKAMPVILECHHKAFFIKELRWDEQSQTLEMDIK